MRTGQRLGYSERYGEVLSMHSKGVVCIHIEYIPSLRLLPSVECFMLLKEPICHTEYTYPQGPPRALLSPPSQESEANQVAGG